jgi:hypothetical protein
MLRVPAVIVVYAALSSIGLAQTPPATTRPDAPRFSAFAVREMYSGPSAVPKFKNARERDYLGPVLGHIAAAPNFAGRFRVVQFRMGGGPIGAVVVDSKTGAVIHLPLDVVRDDFFIHDTDCLSGYHGTQLGDRRDEEEYSAPLSFRTRSELLIVRQCRYDGTAVTGVKWSYYRWHHGKWDLLTRTLAAPPPIINFR